MRNIAILFGMQHALIRPLAAVYGVHTSLLIGIFVASTDTFVTATGIFVAATDTFVAATDTFVAAIGKN